MFPDMTKSKLLFYEICLMLKDVLTIGRVLIYPYQPVLQEGNDKVK